MLVSGKNPRGKKPHPWGVSGSVTVRLGIGLDLGSGSFFPGGFFPRTTNASPDKKYSEVGWKFRQVVLPILSVQVLQFYGDALIVLINTDFERKW